jgi:hypothetical protein
LEETLLRSRGNAAQTQWQRQDRIDDRDGVIDARTDSVRTNSTDGGAPAHSSEMARRYVAVCHGAKDWAFHSTELFCARTPGMEVASFRRIIGTRQIALHHMPPPTEIAGINARDRVKQRSRVGMRGA